MNNEEKAKETSTVEENRKSKDKMQSYWTYVGAYPKLEEAARMVQTLRSRSFSITL
jgi:hypothetical protein